MGKPVLLIWHSESSLWIGFHRQELPQWVSPGAAYDSWEAPSYQYHLTDRGTLKRIEQWIGAKRWTTKLLWLHTPVGEGTSAIAQAVAKTCAEHGQLLASFFFSRYSRGRNSRKHLFPTIAFQICMSLPHKREKLRGMLQDDSYIAYRRVSDSIDLLVSLFSDHPGTPPDGQATGSSPFLVIIDSLDKCQGDNDQSIILSDVRDLLYKHRLPLLFLITSRPKSHIRETFEEPVMSSLTEVVELGADSDFRTRRFPYT